MPLTTKVEKPVTRLTVNSRFLNSVRSIMGSRVRVSWMIKTTSVMAKTTSRMNVNGLLNPPLWINEREKRREHRLTNRMIAPGKSKCCFVPGRLSGTKRATRNTPSIPTGRLTKKSQCQVDDSSRMPPSMVARNVPILIAMRIIHFRGYVEVSSTMWFQRFR